ncbi:DNA polymerase I [Hominifimenecus sp. rT4P-3]|uniref:DNA polymerase I n=1 Tax=Hominifimenecus sp. rT4P-3 TaxID=3242979 RepID=UPI003DA3FF55
MAEKIVLVDGHSILNRAFYGVPELNNSKGIPTNAVYGFLNILFKILEEEKPQYLAVAFDRKEPTFRHQMYEAYKGTRKPMPDALHAQVPIMKEMLTACGVAILELPGYEADDILGTLAKKSEEQGMAVTLVSGDRDLLQIATEHICIRIPKTKGGQTVTENYFAADVKEKYGVTPEEFIDVKALMGDSSDNIPGVPSIGEKTATNLIAAFHSIENAYAHVSEIKPPRAQKALEEHYDMAKMSKTLATICVTAPVEFSFEKASLGNLYTKEAYELMSRLELKSLLKRFDTSAWEMEGQEEKEISFREIKELGDAEEFFAKLKETPCFSVQTVGGSEELLGLAFGLAEDQAVYLECGGFLTAAYLAEQLNQLAETAERIVVLYLKDLLKQLPVQEKPSYFDASVAAYLLNPLKSSYDYADLARDYCSQTIPSPAELLGKTPIAEASPEVFQTHVSRLAAIPFAAAPILAKRLAETGMEKLFLTVEMPLIFSLDRMEKAGVRVEREALKEYGDQLEAQIVILEKEIYEMTGRTFNINSPKQLGEILFDEMKLPGGKKTKTGYSTSADVLEKLKPHVPVVGKILEYRTLAKLKSTYADGLANFIGPDERIHGTFNQTITATGRISSTEPNLQNIPIRMELGRVLRRVFVPEEGMVFVDADYSQIELRVLAHMSGDERLQEAYREEMDIHRITASQVFHIPLDEVSPQQRRNAKAVNFGIVYGISAFGLSEDLSISRKEATDYIQKYFETYPGVKTFLDRLVKEGREMGYVLTLFGRRRPIPELKSSNFNQRSFGERVAMNSPIQGTAADIMKIAMVRVDHRLREEGLRARIILQVHDELLVEAPREEAERVKTLLEEEMSGAASFDVPLAVEVGIGENWLDAK